jgi:hypothetical protein
LDYFQQPKGSSLHFALDYDSSPSEVSDYVQIIHEGLYPEGWYEGLYGNWECLQYFRQQIADDSHNMIHSVVLSQSRGFDDYPQSLKLYRQGNGNYPNIPLLDAWQGDTTTFLDMDVDLFYVNNPNILWKR